MANPFLDAQRATYDHLQGIQQNQLARQAGGAFASGDFGGAANVLARGGDFSNAITVANHGRAQAEAPEKERLAQAAKKVELLGGLYEGLSRIPEAARPQAYQQWQRMALGAGYRQEELPNPTTIDFSDNGVSMFGKGVERAKMEFRNLGDKTVLGLDPYTGEKRVQYDAPREPELVQVDPTKNVYVRNGPASSAPASGGPTGFDAIYDGFIKPQEGGYTASDGNGAPANFGINQKANPDVGDVRNLTPERARQIYQERYWKPSGAEQLQGPLQAIHFDTAVNMGVGAAKNLLQQSGGDPQRYLQLREQRYRAIAARNPARQKELPVWLRRNEALGAFVQGAAPADGQSLPGFQLVQPAQAAAKGEVRPATAEEKAAYGVPAHVPAQIKADGTLDIISLPKGADPQDQAKADQARRIQEGKALSVIGAIDQALEKIGNGPMGFSGEAGVLGKVASNIPGTRAYDAARLIETIKANLGFQELQAMREASPTGGALGQVAVQELIALQATVANLDMGQSLPQLEGNLKKIKQHWTNWLNTVREAGAEGGGVAGMSDDDLKAALGL